ncbi:hypothetical protein DCAR_0208604 [Daucus carota subsp. sativus]|uniref:PRA1 family protein n=1 Tax=Daucus carota subsp. sativus TaxID=79200 RepID=A0AAF0WIV5_DAUCS|nr:PREDICTED: PRA1 family protein F2-like [Daucus carota subsp. sativus]WOG89366.1 hypothetical protein DCAR_0208604 [Daucus carota subsp. sativus]
MTNYGTIPTSSSPGGTNIEFISRAKTQIKAGLATRRPWKEMARSFDLPSGLINTTQRIKININYFLMNYAIIMLIILLLSLLYHPISLMVFFALMAVWLFLYFLRDEPLVIFHRLIDDRTVLIGLSIITFVLLLFTGAVGNIFLAVLFGAVVVAVHAALRRTDDLSLDEEAAETAGLMTTSTSS